MRILITGATGLVGLALMKRLVAEGHDIVDLQALLTSGHLGQGDQQSRVKALFRLAENQKEWTGHSEDHPLSLPMAIKSAFVRPAILSRFPHIGSQVRLALFFKLF